MASDTNDEETSIFIKLLIAQKMPELIKKCYPQWMTREEFDTYVNYVKEYSRYKVLFYGSVLSQHWAEEAIMEEDDAEEITNYLASYVVATQQFLDADKTIDDFCTAFTHLPRIMLVGDNEMEMVATKNNMTVEQGKEARRAYVSSVDFQTCNMSTLKRSFLKEMMDICTDDEISKILQELYDQEAIPPIDEYLPTIKSNRTCMADVVQRIQHKLDILIKQEPSDIGA
jgi:hypothetical protein